MPIIRAEGVSIRYITGDFKDIGLKEYVLRIRGNSSLQVIGQASPGIDKIRDVYRRVIYLKSPRYDMLVKIKDLMEKYIEINSGFDKMRIQFDFNPM